MTSEASTKSGALGATGAARSMLSRRTYALLVALVIALGVFVHREVIWLGFFADDYAQLAMLDGSYPLRREPLDLFDFSDGSVQETRALVRSGFYPWWTHPELRLVMFRPLASMLIQLDHRVFGDDARGYHVHSILWWIALMALAAVLYRRVLEPAHALLAFALFVASFAQGFALSWVCNRAALSSTLFGLAAILWYRRFRERGGGAWLALGCVSYAIAFGFGEYSFCLFGYVFAYEVFHGHGSVRQRASALGWMFAPAFVFVIARAALGANVKHSGLYVDPIANPLGFAGALATRVPVLIGDLMFVLRGDWWTAGTPWLGRWVDRGWVPHRWLLDPEPWRRVHLALALVACVLLWLMARVTLRKPRWANVRWLALGGLISIVPVTASLPSTRLLLVPAFGFSALLAAFVIDCYEGLGDRRAVVSSVLAVVVVGYHVAVPTYLQRQDLAGADAALDRVRQAMLQMGLDDASLPEHDLVLMTALDGASSTYLPMTRERYGRTMPRSCSVLSLVHEQSHVERVSSSAFKLRFDGDTAMLRTAGEQLFRSPSEPLHVGETLDAGIFRATVLEVLDGLPKAVLFQFDRPLESPSLIFLQPTNHSYQRFALPSIGDKRVDAPGLPGMD